MELRDYQKAGKTAILKAWEDGNKNVLFVMATGAGKTVLFSEIAQENVGATCLIAHRQELVGQMSTALAKSGVTHRIIGPKKVIRFCVGLHMRKVGAAYYNPNASIAVAGVDTLIRRGQELANWLPSVTKWITDEGHHVLAANKWGKATLMFPNAIGLGVTAEPSRADGRGLGRHADGLYDVIVEGPNARPLIHAGWLTDYKVLCPDSGLDLSKVSISAQTGDYSLPQLRSAIKEQPKIIGDVVEHYKEYCNGKLGITFATDVESASEIAVEFNKQGVPAEVVSHKTSDAARTTILERFERKEILQLVNVDLFGEGFDLPSVQCISMARPTESFPLYLQQFGRGLRVMTDVPWEQMVTQEIRLKAIADSDKPCAWVIDHVGNVGRHLLPDTPRPRTLDSRKGRGRLLPEGHIPVRICVGCTQPYPAIYKACIYCGLEFVPAGRSKPEQVDGDLILLSPEVLAQLRGEVLQLDKDKEDYRGDLIGKNIPRIGQWKMVNKHCENQERQKALRTCMKWWGGIQEKNGLDASQTQRLFYFKFGVDVMSAQALGAKAAIALGEKIAREVGRGAL